MRRKESPKEVIAPLQKLPIDHALPEGVPLEGDAVFVRLPTLAAFEEFWAANRQVRPCCAEGVTDREGQRYLNEYDWVFAPTKAAVVKTVARWDVFGIVCEWHDWTRAGEQHCREMFFEVREEIRRKYLGTDEWTSEDEADYQMWTRDTYTGWWMLGSLPLGAKSHEWLEFSPEIRDKNLPVEVVTRLLQEQVFDGGMNDQMGAMGPEVKFHEAEGVDQIIAYERKLRAAGDWYYGCENEPGWIPPSP